MRSTKSLNKHLSFKNDFELITNKTNESTPNRISNSDANNFTIAETKENTLLNSRNSNANNFNKMIKKEVDSFSNKPKYLFLGNIEKLIYTNPKKDGCDNYFTCNLLKNILVQLLKYKNLQKTDTQPSLLFYLKISEKLEEQTEIYKNFFSFEILKRKSVSLDLRKLNEFFFDPILFLENNLFNDLNMETKVLILFWLVNQGFITNQINCFCHSSMMAYAYKETYYKANSSLWSSLEFYLKFVFRKIHEDTTKEIKSGLNDPKIKELKKMKQNIKSNIDFMNIKMECKADRKCHQRNKIFKFLKGNRLMRKFFTNNSYKKYSTDFLVYLIKKNNQKMFEFHSQFKKLIFSDFLNKLTKLIGLKFDYSIHSNHTIWNMRNSMRYHYL
jgi:hypothetical protein